MLGKTFKGLTDEMLQWQTEKLASLQGGATAGPSTFGRGDLPAAARLRRPCRPLTINRPVHCRSSPANPAVCTHERPVGGRP